MPIKGPPSCEEYADRASDCRKAIEPRFNELVDQQADLFDILEEATAVGWSREEVTLALNGLLEREKERQATYTTNSRNTPSTTTIGDSRRRR